MSSHWTRFVFMAAAAGQGPGELGAAGADGRDGEGGRDSGNGKPALRLGPGLTLSVPCSPCRPSENNYEKCQI